MTIPYEEIAARAFQIWQENGEIEGEEQAHWLRAEAELRKESLKPRKGKKIQRPSFISFKTSERANARAAQKH